jgi:hypothetical protein
MRNYLVLHLARAQKPTYIGLDLHATVDSNSSANTYTAESVVALGSKVPRVKGMREKRLLHQSLCEITHIKSYLNIKYTLLVNSIFLYFLSI